jgi:cysteine desulfurase/selenocysteine lyase
VSPLHQPAAGSAPRPGEDRRAAPLDRVSDFPAIPDGWAYLDTAATAQKPRAVIDSITRGYAETYATVHRGVYQRSADMTLAFEAAAVAPRASSMRACPRRSSSSAAQRRASIS